MKTPTLIVRLVGLYLLAGCSVLLFQIHKLQAQSVPNASQNDALANSSLYAWLGLVAGVVATLFAGPLARLLTFDSEPKKKPEKFSDIDL